VILSLGIPRDTLSVSLLSFLKYFSLPLDTESIRQIRREVLALEDTGTLKDEIQKDGAPKTRRETVALAAAAVRDKGLSLSVEALREYAAAIGGNERPESRRNREAGAEPRDGPEDRQGDGGTPREAGDGAAGGGQDGNGGERGGGENRGKQPDGRRPGTGTTPPGGLTPEGLREAAESAAQGGLLDLLNKLPGKNGRRWIVLPFSYAAGGVDFKVSLRILLSEQNTIPREPERLILDVGSEKRLWSFMLEKAGGQDSGQCFNRAEIGVFPPPGAPAVLEKELRKLLETTADHITLRDLSGAFLFEGDWDGKNVPAINEEV
jgi:hypothetical protein